VALDAGTQSEDVGGPLGTASYKDGGPAGFVRLNFGTSPNLVTDAVRRMAAAI
jgi:bifunctional pyridoxal-dependent enzyme with beta-cystathionase and maltose regulon repressor activities